MASLENDNFCCQKNKILLTMSSKSKIFHPELDTPDTTIDRRKIIQKKYFLYNVYRAFYFKISDSLTIKNKKGTIVELGSGAGFIKKIIPHAITSDILKLPKIDLQFSATNM